MQKMLASAAYASVGVSLGQVTLQKPHLIRACFKYLHYDLYARTLILYWK